MIVTVFQNGPGRSATDFVNFIAPIVEGQSIIGDLLLTVARNITWPDLVSVIQARHSVPAETLLGRLRTVLRDFAHTRLLEGSLVSTQSVARVCEQLLAELRPFISVMVSKK